MEKVHYTLEYVTTNKIIIIKSPTIITKAFKHAIFQNCFKCCQRCIITKISVSLHVPTLRNKSATKK